MGPQDQPEFVNAAAGLLTALGPRELLEAMQAIERRHGPDAARASAGVHAVIDLDLVALFGRKP